MRDWERYEAHYRREFPKLVRTLMLGGAGLHDAEDAAHAALAETWKLFSDGRWEDVRTPAGWLVTVARRKRVRPDGLKRRQPPTVPVADVLDRPDPRPDIGELTVQARHVIEALWELPEDERSVMALHVDGLRPVDIAPVLGLDEQRVRDLLRRARTKLKRILLPPEGRES